MYRDDYRYGYDDNHAYSRSDHRNDEYSSEMTTDEYESGRSEDEESSDPNQPIDDSTQFSALTSDEDGGISSDEIEDNSDEVDDRGSIIPKEMLAKRNRKNKKKRRSKRRKSKKNKKNKKRKKKRRREDDVHFDDIPPDVICTPERFTCVSFAIVFTLELIILGFWICGIFLINFIFVIADLCLLALLVKWPEIIIAGVSSIFFLGLNILDWALFYLVMKDNKSRLTISFVVSRIAMMFFSVIVFFLMIFSVVFMQIYFLWIYEQNSDECEVSTIQF